MATKYCHQKYFCHNQGKIVTICVYEHSVEKKNMFSHDDFINCH